MNNKEFICLLRDPKLSWEESQKLLAEILKKTSQEESAEIDKIIEEELLSMLDDEISEEEQKGGK